MPQFQRDHELKISDLRARDHPAFKVHRYLPRDGWLIEFGSVDHAYNPLAYPQLLAEFAQQPFAENEGLKFVVRWGLPSFAGGDDDGGPPRVGDETARVAESTVKGHAESIERLMRMLEYRQGADEAGLRSYLQSLAGASAPGRATIRFMSGREESAYELSLGQGSLITQVEGLVRKAVNENVSGPPGLSFVVEEPLRLNPVATNLMQAIYWHLVVLTSHPEDPAAPKPIGRCQSESCGKMFVRTHGHQNFCAPPPDSSGSESLCAARSRKAKQRKAMRETEGLDGPGR
ncbi:MAG TPA: hypothetical protein VMR52_10975 [Dehalococcoidia bacterium]|nr:hypothetical protein [Dehalococcoidia bacterium]